MLNTAVALIVFRRPALTMRVLDAVAQVKPRKLLVIADGPRPDHLEDHELCAATRAVIERVDWECEVIKNYSDVNLGCGRRPATGISWVFEQVPEAIILEDDCVPHPTFFRFCEELLERYREDERVMHIAGSTYRRDALPTPHSYFFSQWNGAWGWATWRRAWRYFDPAVRLWPQLEKTSWLADLLESEVAMRYWADVFTAAYERQGDIDYWDHQWTFACWAHSGLSITPRDNLVSNVGCNADATHTLWENDPNGNIPIREVTFPLAHPPNVLQSREIDRDRLHKDIVPRLNPARRSRARRIASRVAPEFVKQAYRKLVSPAVS
jgi:hypothetical protein